MNIIVSPPNVTWYSNYMDAMYEMNPILPTALLTDGSTYFAVNNENGCPSEPFPVWVSLSLKSKDFSDFSIQLQPNPANIMLTIQASNHRSIDRISISDLTGKVVLTQSTNTTLVNVEPLTSGMYIIEVVSGEDKLISKFVKE
jgi:hypothetical protein